MMRTLVLAALAAAAMLGGCRSDIETIRHLDTAPPHGAEERPAS